MVTSPTGKGVFAMGGIFSGGRSKAMFELSASMQWTRLEHTLKIGHCAPPLAIPIPDDLVYEKVESEKIQCSLPENRPSMKNYVLNKFVNLFKLFK